MTIEIPSEEVIARFDQMLETFDLSREMDVLELGRFEFRQRKKALLEFNALFVALWKLALEKSFPDRAESIFEEFVSDLERHVPVAVKQKEILLRAVYVYITLLQPNLDSDFSEIGQHMVKIFRPGDEKSKAKVLKLSLRVREIFTIIFNGLI